MIRGNHTSKRPIRILILEDDASDFELIKRELRGIGLDHSVEWAQDKGAFLRALSDSPWDLTLLDYSLPGFDGLSALALARQSLPDIPAIIVSGAIGEELAIETMKAGAADYVLKQRLGRLRPVIHRALQDAEHLAERKRAEEALRRNGERLEILSETAGRLLASDEPQRIVDELCIRVMKFLECQVFFNYLLDECSGKLRLNAYAGIPEEVARSIEWLEMGTAICGCVANSSQRIVSENIQEVPDSRADLVRPFGIKAYACHPLMAREKVMGTLSFGTRSRTSFGGDDLAMMRAVTDQVAIAMSRIRTECELLKARDELELRVLERTAELSRAKEAAEAAAEAKAAFLANMSHELRTPLNTVIGYSSLLLNDDITQEQKENIESIKKGGEALLTIISEILEFSRSEKEEMELERQPLSLKHCIEESLDMVAVQAEQKGLNLAYTISHGTPETIIGDYGRLRQIFSNLFSNAVKFTDKGDISISVSSKVIEGRRRKFFFAVKDTGIGMPQDKMGRLFKPFTQLEYIISRKRDGVGLGLAICKKLVELMEGEIWVESEEGRGSIFRFTIEADTIPNRRLYPREKDRTACRDISAKRPLSILVAEDNPSNQKVLVEMLKWLGYRADAVADGKEVLQILKIRPYDLVFMDIRMPEMDGITTAREIRRLWPARGPKIIAVTAFAMDGDREKCLGAGMDGYIAKPLKVDDLARLLCSIDLKET